MKIPYNKAFYCEEEIKNIRECLSETGSSSEKKYTKLCEDWFKDKIGKKIILTHSCTAALEMAALLINIEAGDEVIMPSYTYVSTANAFVLRGAIPVFIDINANTVNMDENLIERAITDKTKAIVVVHYAGISCNMSKIIEIANKYNLIVIEDAAHAFGAKYKNQDLGCIGDIGCYSFHETKNITSGEGGMIIINNTKYNYYSDIISRKGTNVKSFLLGNIDKYTWVNEGSSYRMSDINAAMLYAQLQNYEEIQKKRLYIWNFYYNFFKNYEEKGYIRCPNIPNNCEHNAHIFFILFHNKTIRDNFIKFMKKKGVNTPFHYIPLHSSEGGKQYGKIASSMENTNSVANTIVRLPIFYDLSDEQIQYICYNAGNFIKTINIME